jgi:hypothetical protein
MNRIAVGIPVTTIVAMKIREESMRVFLAVRNPVP